MKPFWSIEPLLQEWRIRRVLPDLIYGGVYLDIGCDLPPVLINRVKRKMKRCIGVDLIAKPGKYENVEIMSMDINKKIYLPDNSVDIITLLAVLEHLKYPEKIVKECYRILKPGGRLLLTVPSPMNKPLLELLAKFRFVRPEMIHQHENYFTHQQLKTILNRSGFEDVKVKAFEFGLNTFAISIKLDDASGL